MKFNINQQDLQQALSYCQGVIEKRSTFQYFNVLLNVSNSSLILTATDLDLIFIHQIKNIEVWRRERLQQFPLLFMIS